MAMKTAAVAELIRKSGLELTQDTFTKKTFNRKRKMLEHSWVEVGEITDNIIPILQVYLERNFDNQFPTAKIKDAIKIVAVENQFREPAARFDKYEKEWDGKNRIDDLGKKFFGNSQANEALRLMMLYMVAGAYGHVVDWQYTIDLIGRQGTGKTQFLKRLGGEYYTDQITSFRDKDSLEVMAGSLLVNDDEMLVSSGKSSIEFKKFISSVKLTFRASYGYVSETHKRHFVIARTTNNFSYIKDLTGNRRIIPVIVYEKNRDRHPATITNEEASQIIGEAVHEFDWNRLQLESREFDKKIGEIMKETIKELSSDGDFADKVEKYIELRDGESFGKNDVFDYITEQDASLLTESSARYLKQKIVDVLSAMGYREKVVRYKGKTKRLMLQDEGEE